MSEFSSLNSLMLDHGPLMAFAVIFSIFSTRALFIAGGATIWIVAFAWPKSRKVVLPTQEKTEMGRDILRAFGILAFDSAVFAFMLYTGLFVPDRAPSGLMILGTILFYAVWMEIYFYFSHRALHHPKLYWIHRFHHEGRGTNPWTSVAFSYTERLILLAGSFAPAVIASRFMPVSVDAFALYFLINYLFNVYHHLNVELMPASFRRTALFAWMGTSVSHGLHHLRYKGNYGLYTRHLDRWLGTDFADYPEVFDRVVAGQGALKEARVAAT